MRRNLKPKSWGKVEAYLRDTNKEELNPEGSRSAKPSRGSAGWAKRYGHGYLNLTAIQCNC